VVEIKAIVNNYKRETLKLSIDSRPVTQISGSAIRSNAAGDHQSVAQTSDTAVSRDSKIRYCHGDTVVVLCDSPSSYVSFYSQVSMRLPEIILPKFEGDFRSWPDFRDRFVELVIRNKDIKSDNTRFYYLLGCLQADWGEILKRILVKRHLSVSLEHISESLR